MSYDKTQTKTAEVLKAKGNEKMAKMAAGFTKVTPDKPMEVGPSTKEYFPTLNLKLTDIPEAKDWKIGGKYTISLQVEQTAIRQSKEKNGGGDVTFEIKGIKIG